MVLIESSWAERRVKTVVTLKQDAVEFVIGVDVTARLEAVDLETIATAKIEDIRFEGDLLVSCHIAVGPLEIVGVLDATCMEDWERQELWTYEPCQCHPLLIVTDGGAVRRREYLPFTLRHWSTVIALINECGARHEAAKRAIEVTEHPFGRLVRRQG